MIVGWWPAISSSLHHRQMIGCLRWVRVGYPRGGMALYGHSPSLFKAPPSQRHVSPTLSQSVPVTLSEQSVARKDLLKSLVGLEEFLFELCLCIGFT